MNAAELQYGGALPGQFGYAAPGSAPNDEPVLSHPTMAGYGGGSRAWRRDPARNARVTEIARLMRDVIAGDVDPFFFREAFAPRTEIAVHWLRENYPNLYSRNMNLREVMSVSDYQALYVDVLDRLYYGFYNAYPIVNLKLVRQHDLRDFRLVSRFLLDGLVSPFTAQDAASPAPEQSLSGPVPQNNATFPTTNTAPIQYQPSLYSARAAVNWRAMVNDDLGIFKDIANRLATVANRGISKYITGFFFGTSGLNPTLFSSGYSNLITTANGASMNNPPLNMQGVIDAWKVLARMQDSSGNPILPTGTPYLVYGPSYKGAVENLMGASRMFVSNEGGTANAQGFPQMFVDTANWAMQNMVPIMDPYMPIVMAGASGNIAQTAWALVLDPNAQERPGVEVGFLNGFKTPQLFRRMPNTMRVGGGVDETMGNFDTYDNDLKIVSVFGGKAIDGRSMVGSTGAQS